LSEDNFKVKLAFTVDLFKYRNELNLTSSRSRKYCDLREKKYFSISKHVGPILRDSEEQQLASLPGTQDISSEFNRRFAILKNHC
jgi:hypothetical protein